MRARVFEILMVAAVLFLASAAPAFAQDDVQYNAVCQNIIGQVDTDITQNATATAGAAGGAAEEEGATGGDAEAVARIAQEAGVSIEQVNECLNEADGGNGDGNGNGKGDEDGKGKVVNVDSANTAAARQYGVIVKTIPDDKVLANTGGFPILAGSALMLAASVVVGSMVIRRR